MATQDNNPGLLSKVARFVRPAVDHGGLRKVEPAANEVGENSKQALKQMIERKAHNDAVRKREFNQLRKLRSTPPGTVGELAVRTSFFRDSSGASLIDDRAMTLKKIDEIEAHMSRQWWKGRQGATPAGTAEERPVTQAVGHPPLPGSPPEADSGFESTLISNLSDSVDAASTQMGDESDLLTAIPTSESPRKGNTRNLELTGSNVFSSSKMVSIDMGPSLSDPALEEAAIRFANSDDAGAESVLLTALQTPGASAESADIWAAALFDLYRGTGQQASFERMALDYAQRFGRTAPAWFSTPQILGLNQLPAARVSAPSTETAEQNLWVCPDALDLRSVERLASAAVTRAGPCLMNWHSLRKIAPDAAKALAVLFAQWCNQPTALCFAGAEVLEQVLRLHTPVGDHQVAPVWWQLRMDAMRILSQQDEFELAALDFCVTYELSPTPWVPARCRLSHGPQAVTQLMPIGGAANQEAAFVASASRAAGHAVWPTAGIPGERHFEFSGEVLGDADAVLAPLQALSQQDGALMISCRHLMRVDFSAAGSILNWVANAEAAGNRIELRDVPRLIAAFFNLIGINEHARIIVLSN